VVENTLVESMELLEFDTSERISSDLITFSMLPQSRWKNLLSLDVIRVCSTSSVCSVELFFMLFVVCSVLFCCVVFNVVFSYYVFYFLMLYFFT